MASYFNAVVCTVSMLGSPFLSATDTPPVLWRLATRHTFPTFQELAYTTGLRGAHLFINVPPEERNPASLATPSESVAAYKQRIDEFNAALRTSVAQFAQNHTDLTVLTFDAHSWFNEMLDNAEEYGFTNITG